MTVLRPAPFLTGLRESSLSLWLPWTTPSRMNRSKSKSKLHYDWRSVSKSWCRAPFGAHDQIFITVWQLRSCFCGAPSLTRGRFCLLYMLLALASAVFLGSESFATHEYKKKLDASSCPLITSWHGQPWIVLLCTTLYIVQRLSMEIVCWFSWHGKRVP
jgi:hypothetical protein